MSKTTMWIIGGLAVVGIILMVSTKKSSSGGEISVPQATAISGIPQFPQAPPMPAFQVQANPSYLYFNMPSDRNQIKPSGSEAKKDGCGCGGDCQQIVAQTSIPVEQNVKQAKQLASRFSLGPNPSTMLQQFPPALYPWLYNSGGSA